MIRALSLLSVLSCLALFGTGCSQRLVDFTVISTKNVDWSRATSFKRAQTRAQGTDTTHIIIFIPTGIPNMKEAIDRAIESVPGAVALVDGVLYQKLFYIPLIYGQSSYVIEGTPLVDPALASGKSDATTDYIVAYCDKRGNVERVNYTTKQDYDLLREKAIPSNRGLSSHESHPFNPIAQPAPISGQ